jgi:Ca2+-binding RTX toxin-like protein
MADAFVFATPLNSHSNVDTISNFSVLEGDKIWIDRTIFMSGFEGVTQVDNGSDLELHFSGTPFAILSGRGSNPLTASDFVGF